MSLGGPLAPGTTYPIPTPLVGSGPCTGGLAIAPCNVFFLNPDPANTVPLSVLGVTFRIDWYGYVAP